MIMNILKYLKCSEECCFNALSIFFEGRVFFLIPDNYDYLSFSDLLAEAEEDNQTVFHSYPGSTSSLAD